MWIQAPLKQIGVDTDHLVLFSSVAVKLTLSFSLFCIDIESLYPCPISGSVLCKDNNTILYFVMLSIILSLVVHSTTVTHIQIIKSNRNAAIYTCSMLQHSIHVKRQLLGYYTREKCYVCDKNA